MSRPIAALIGGINAPADRVMGHAGAFTLPGETSASAKVEALKAAGVTIVNHPSRFGPVLRTLLSNPSLARAGGASSQPSVQQRHMHTLSRRSTLESRVLGRTVLTQKRTIYVTQNAAFNMIRENLTWVRDPKPSETQRILAVSINRSSGRPCVIAAPGTDMSQIKRFDFDYGGEANLPISDIRRQLGLGKDAFESLRRMLGGLVRLFMQKEAFLLDTRVIESGGVVEVAAARFGFDDAAFRSCGRHAEIQKLRDFGAEDPAEVEAEKHGIVYIKMNGNIGVSTPEVPHPACFEERIFYSTLRLGPRAPETIAASPGKKRS